MTSASYLFYSPTLGSMDVNGIDGQPADSFDDLLLSQPMQPPQQYVHSSLNSSLNSRYMYSFAPPAPPYNPHSAPMHQIPPPARMEPRSYEPETESAWKSAPPQNLRYDKNSRIYNMLNSEPPRNYPTQQPPPQSRKIPQNNRNQTNSRTFKLQTIFKNNSFSDMISQRMVADLATDQNGSRFIQQQLESASLEEKQAVFDQILPEALRLCTDVFGNYVVQKFFEHGSVEQKHALAREIQYSVLPLSLQMYGCRVVQKILESVDVELQSMLIQELDGHVLECVKDQNANHVIQKCIEQVSSSHNMIQKSFYGRVYDLSTHPYGCRVIQRMLEHWDRELKAPLLDELMTYAEQLAKDQYGNYVLQHVLQHTRIHSSAIIRSVAENMLPFSKHKFASNVVERCFSTADVGQRDCLLDAVIGNQESSPLVSMVRDQYGNYVIQKMLETLSPQQRNRLIRKIGEYVPNIRKIAFGKHIVLKIEKLTGKRHVEL